VFEQIKGFGSYGFPESHAASFALLAYASSWLKCHEPAAFACALLDAQPMGLYAPGQILQDLRRHGVAVLAPDVMASDWESRLGPATATVAAASGQPAIQLGLREIKGMREAAALRIGQARAERAFTQVQDLAERAGLDAFDLARLAEAGALKTLAGDRHQARWQVHGVTRMPAVLAGARIHEPQAELPIPDAGSDLRHDYAALGYTLGVHPMQLLRPQIKARRALEHAQLLRRPNGCRVRAAGLVTMRQRPGTAAGVTFLTLEDETGWLNVIVWANVHDRQRRVLRESRLLAVEGELQHADGVSHLIAQRLLDWSDLLDGLNPQSRDFR